jgi:hypothetical protein
MAVAMTLQGASMNGPERATVLRVVGTVSRALAMQVQVSISLDFLGSQEAPVLTVDSRQDAPPGC